MIAVEEKLLDQITATFHHLRAGKSLNPSLYRMISRTMRSAKFLPM